MKSLGDEDLTNKLLVFDTNILLSVFRLDPNQREELINALAHFQQYLWIPKQVHSEFERNADNIVQKQISNDKAILNLLCREKVLKLDLSEYRFHPWIRKEDIDSIFDIAIQAAKAKVKEQRSAFDSKNPIRKYLKLCTALRDKVNELFHGRVGASYTTAEYLEKAKLAKLRMELKVPPGFVSRESDDMQFRIGDILLWYQMMEESSKSGKSIVFVTRDSKKDWWLDYDECVLEPALHEEFRQVTGQDIIGLTWEKFCELSLEARVIRKESTLSGAVSQIPELGDEIEPPQSETMRLKIAAIGLLIDFILYEKGIQCDSSDALAEQVGLLVEHQVLTEERGTSILQLMAEAEPAVVNLLANSVSALEFVDVAKRLNLEHKFLSDKLSELENLR